MSNAAKMINSSACNSAACTTEVTTESSSSDSTPLMTVSGERESVLSEPGSAARASLGGGVSMAFAQSARRLPGSRLPAKLPMLLLRLADPLNSGISADGSMSRIHHDDFIIFVSGILADPVGIQHAQGTDFTSHALLSDRLERALELHLVDAMMSRLAVSASFGNGLLARTASDADAVDHKPLLGAVTQSARFFNARWLRSAMDARELSELPRADSEEESHHVALLLPPQFVDIFISAHFWAYYSFTFSKSLNKLKLLNYKLPPCTLR